MKAIDVKFQCYIPKSIGKPMMSHFENQRLFSPKYLTNYDEFKRQLMKADNNGKHWFAEPDIGEFLGRYASTDTSDFHSKDHKEHTVRIGVYAAITPDKIGKLEKISPTRLLG